MKIGTLTSVALVALGLLSALVMVTDKEDDISKEIEQKRSVFTVYDNKKMYIEAAGELKAIANLDPKNYENAVIYKDYCLEHDFSKEFSAACQRVMSMKPNDPKPAKEYLNYLEETKSKEIYEFVKKKINDMDGDDKTYFSDYYDSIKGNFVTLYGKYDEIMPWTNDYILVTKKDGSLGLMGGKGLYSFAKREGKTFVVAADNSIILSCDYDKIYSYSASNRYISVVDENQMVYVDSSSNRKIVPYDAKSAKLLEYDYLGTYFNGVANYCNEGNWGYINSAPNPIATGYKHTTPLINGVGALQNESGKWAFVKFSSEDGFKLLTEYTFDDVYLDEYGFPFSYGYCYVKSGGKWKLMRLTLDEKNDITGLQSVGALSFDDVKTFDINAAVCVSGKWGFIDLNGNWILEPTYDDAFSFGSGLAPVKKDGKWGYVDTKGKMVIEPTFDMAYGFNRNGIAAVKQENIWKYIQLLEYKYKE